MKEYSSDINIISKDINEMALQKGYWKNGIELHKKLLLIISEAVEAMEADRVDNYCDLADEALLNTLNHEDDETFCEIFELKCKHTFGDEIADLIIRSFDLAFIKQINLPLLIALKMRYNKLNTDLKKKY